MVTKIIDRLNTGSNIDQLIKAVIAEDSECGHNKDNTPGLRRRWACLGCRQFSNFKLTDKSIGVTVFETPLTHSKITQSRIPFIQSVIAKNVNIQSCTPDIESFKRYTYLNLDQASLDIINRYLVSQSIKPKLAFRCNNITTVVYENFHSIDDMTLNSEVVTLIIEQLVVMCRQMAQQKLTHNNPLITAIKLKPKRYRYDQDSIAIKGDYELLLDKFDQSSGQLGDNVRTTHIRTPILNTQPECNVVVCRSGLSEFNNVCQVGVSDTYTSYVFDPKVVEVRISGLPLFYESLDFYGLMTILMTRKQFYDVVMTTRRLREMWLRMWDPVEYFTLIERLTKHHADPSTMLTGFEIITGLRLRCDVIPRCVRVLWE